MRLMDVLSMMMEQSAAKGEPRLLPTRELFEHVQENQHLFKGVVRGRGLEFFFEKGQEYWSQKIASELQARLQKGYQPSVPIPVMTHFVAGTFVLMLRWWLDNKMPYSPEEMDKMLQALIMPGIQNSLGISRI